MSCRRAVAELGARRVLRFRCSGCGHGASMEGSESCMREGVLALLEIQDVHAIMLEDLYQREYAGESLDALKEVALALAELRRFSLKPLATGCGRCNGERKELLARLKDSLANNPLRARRELEQAIAEFRPKLERGAEACRRCRGEFVKGLEGLLSSISQLRLAKKHADEVLHPLTRPCFLTPFISVDPPPGAELIDAYGLNGGEVRVYRFGLQHLYFLTPLEYTLPSEQVALLHRARQALLERGGGLELDPIRARNQIEYLGADLLAELAAGDGLQLGEGEIKLLAGSLARFTAGLGILETLLSDARIQDIYIDAPIGRMPVHLYHRDFEECLTNVYFTPEDAEILSSRFRAFSGRQFSESNPVLDLELDGVRVAAISKPLSPEGQAFSLRRHKPTPWTLPQFIEARFLTPRAAGLLSLLVDAQTSMLIAGCRGAGKTSLLGALMLEILPNFRILVLEDTSELPIAQLRSLGFKVQAMRTQSPVRGSGTELRAEDALLAALRMGESVLIVGEVRGPEAKTLYEAMRVGATGNSVMGTIHGATALDVFERVVHDLGIPPSSFGATEAVVAASLIRPRGGVHRVRRVAQVAEVRGGQEFEDLMAYDPSTDELEITPELSERSRLIQRVARKWGTKPKEVLRNLELRARVFEELVKTAAELKAPHLLEAGFTVRSNLTLHELLEGELRRGKLNHHGVFESWRGWLAREARG